MTYDSTVATGLIARPSNVDPKYLQFPFDEATRAPRIFWGTGSPEGIVPGIVGDTYYQTDGTNGTMLWFKRSGTGNTGWAAIASTGHLNIGDAGAVGDGATNDSSAINAAAVVAIASDLMLTGTPGKTYKIDATVDFTGLKYCDFRGVTFNYGLTSGNCLLIGGSTSSVEDAVLYLPNLKGTIDSLPTGTGIVIQGLKFSEVHFQRTRFFAKGLMVQSGAGLPLAYNTFYTGNVDDCLIGIDIKPLDAAAWCNENLVIGGRIGIGSTFIGEAGNRYIRIDKFTAGFIPDAWTFLHVSLEGDVERTIDAIECKDCLWIGCRFELVTDITFGAAAYDNHIMYGSQTSSWQAAFNDANGRNTYETSSRGGRTWVRTLDDNATPSVSGIETGKTGGTTTITDFDDGVVGQRFDLLAAHSVTITHNASIIKLKDGVSFAMVSGDSLTLRMLNDQVWEEVGRKQILSDGYRQTVEGWYQDDVAASQSAVVLSRADGATYTGVWIAPRPGSITAVNVKTNDARTAGTLTVEVYKNTAQTGLTAVLDGTNATHKATTQAKDTDTFVAGDELDIRITTDAGWLPVTADIRASLEVET